MTNEELQAVVEKAVHEMNYYSVKSHTVAAVVAALAPLVVEPEPEPMTWQIRALTAEIRAMNAEQRAEKAEQELRDMRMWHEGEP